ncbi:hypothetical protein MAC_07447 [Metarhizium acridum CQMa 102]|uniref:Uncharacterized protein n=1 Tax=Metarhizium acridum (strain CQMa 102) TaxID=655827 RepID=E9EC38_METAQ|nr:uncharacterized protein MAC_07447 [Metarhizium acridum CQMa 102]EFY86504.1 hypothetical protein MAC_07447 [Metarhizium acridum CQMa 102]
MKFFAVTLLALATAVMAAPSGPSKRVIAKRQNKPANLVAGNDKDIFIRQEFVVDTDTAAMTDSQGNVVPFDSSNVNLANTDAGF